MNAHIRWMLRRDMPDVMAIENSTRWPWSEENFLRALRQCNCIGMVAESPGGQIVGFMVYLLRKKRVQVLNFAVHPDFRRQGVGRRMIAKLYGKLSSHRRTQLVLLSRESNLEFHLFLRSVGFKARCVVREHCVDTGEDAYDFRLDFVPELTEAKSW